MTVDVITEIEKFCRSGIDVAHRQGISKLLLECSPRTLERILDICTLARKHLDRGLLTEEDVKLAIRRSVSFDPETGENNGDES